MADNQYTNASAGIGGLSSPFANMEEEKLVSPFQNGEHPVQEETGIWDTMKSNFGARVDAVAAAMLQDESSDRSRYAMKRAQASNQLAAEKEEALPAWKKVGVVAADIGTGLGLSAVPYVGPEAAMAYFGTQGTADILRQQAATDNKYDLDKAVGGGMLMAGADALTGGAAANIVSRNAVADTFRNRAIQSMGQGAASGGAQQMIANLASNRPWNEGLAEGIIGGGVAGGAVHSGIEGARSIKERMPTTLENAGNFFQRNADNGAAAKLAERMKAEREQAGARPQEDEGLSSPFAEEAPSSAPEDNGFMGQPQPQRDGAIPTEEPQPSQQYEGDRIPGTENFDPNEYGQGPQGAWRHVQPGQGFGGGANDGSQVSRLRGISNKFKEMFELERNPQGIKNVQDSDLSTEALGMKPANNLREAMSEIEGTSAILHDHMSQLPPDSTDLANTASAKVNLEAQEGTPAALGRRDQLANLVDFNPTDNWNNIKVTDGWVNKSGERDLGDEFGISRKQMKSSEIHLRDAGENPLLFSGNNPKYQDELLTRESYLQHAHEKYKRAKNVVLNSANDNIHLADSTMRELADYSGTGSREYDWAHELKSDLNEYRRMIDGVGGKYEEVDPAQVRRLSKRIEINANRLGLAGKMKNIVGKTGSFSPFLDMQGWHTFHGSMEAIHKNIPTHSFKGGDVPTDLENSVSFAQAATGGVGKAAGWAVNRSVKTATNAYDRTGLLKSQKRGRVMAQELAREPTRAPTSEQNVQEALKRGSFDEAAVHADDDLKGMGYETETTQQKAQSEVERMIAEDEANAQPEVAPEAPQNTVETPEANVEQVPSQAPETAPEAPRSAPVPPTRDVQKTAKAPQKEMAPKASPEQHAELRRLKDGMAGNENLTADEAALRIALGNANRQNGAENAAGLASRPEKRTTPEPEVTPEAPKETPDMVTESSKRAKKKTEEEEQAPKEEKVEEPKSEKEETKEPTKKEAEEANEPETPKESPEDRAKRVSEMARKPVVARAEEVLKSPAGEAGALVQSRARQVKRHMPDVIEYVKDIANKNQFDEGDIWEALMTMPKGGVENVFRDGFNKQAITGIINNRISEVRNAAKRVAKGYVDEAGAVVRKRLDEFDIPTTKKGVEDKIRADIISKGGDDSVVSEAFKRAKRVTPYYTPAQVRRYAAQILKEQAKGVRTNRSVAKTELPTKSSKESLQSYLDTLGLPKSDMLRAELQSKLDSATNGGKSELDTKAQNDTVKDLIGAIKSHRDALLKLADRKNQKPDEVKRLKAEVEKLSEALERQGAARTKLDQINSENKAEIENRQKREDKQRQEAETKAAKLEQAAKEIVEEGEAYEKKIKEATKAVTKDLEEKVENMTGSELESTGDLIGDKLPDVDSIHDPEYVQWKAQMEVAEKGLREKGRIRSAEIIGTTLKLMDKGLARREELPDAKYKHLILSEEEYQGLSKALGKDDKGDLDTDKATVAYFGNMGRKIRSALLGNSSWRSRETNIKLSDKELAHEREAILEMRKMGMDEGISEKKYRGAIKTDE